MKKVFLIFTALILLFPTASRAAHLVILEINDTHGHAWAYNQYHDPDIGGFAAIATVVNRVRKEAKEKGWDFLFLHAGDLNTGVPESDLLDAKPDIAALNMMGLDAMTIGNHEFDKSQAVLRQQMDLAHFPFLCANVVYKGTDRTLGSPYTIKDFPDLKVAILGLTTMTTRFVGNPENIKYYSFLSPIDVAKHYVPLLHKLVGKDGVVLALTHLGIFGVGDGAVVENNPKTIQALKYIDRPDDPMGGSVSLAQSVPGIAAIMDGHSHTVVKSPLDINHERIIQAGCYTRYVARLDLDIEKGQVTQYDYKLIPINLKVAEKGANGKTVYQYVDKKIAPDPAVAAMLARYEKAGGKKLYEPIGTSKVNFENTGQTTRQKDTPIAHLITDAVAWKFSDVQVVLLNGGSIRAGLAPGTITYRDILSILPFGDTIVTMNLRGYNLLKAIEWGALHHPEAPGARLNPYGLTYTVKGKEVKDIRVHGKPLNPYAFYSVATIDYLAAGGDNYTVLRKGKNPYNTGYVLADVVRQYVQHIRPINDFAFTPRWTEAK